MKNVLKFISCIFIIVKLADSATFYRKNSRSSRPYSQRFHFSFIKINGKTNYANQDSINISRYKYSRKVLRGLNEEKVDLHPDTLSGVERKITEKREKELREKGIIEGYTDTWRNWHVLNQGQWDEIGSSILPKSEGPLNITEPYALRRPLKYWGFMRGVDSNITSYPIIWEYYNDTYGKYDGPLEGGGNPFYSPALFQPTWLMDRDRRGTGYDDVRCFEGWIGSDETTPTRVKSASDLILIPDTGRRYQKFYMGPYPVTMGWSIGSLLKAITQTRCPGYAVVAIKIHNMNEDTTITGSSDDLLNIALNLKGVALETLEPGKEARIRTLVKGPSLLCAGGLEWPSFVKLSTPETYITKLDKGAELDIELKIEWGRGFWLADSDGLHKMEEGADSVCLRRRRIKEVDQEGFYPTSAVFGGCRMIRLAVHKLMGQRWDMEKSTCPDPMDQLVVEIWTDASTTPKDVLEYGLTEVITWLTELKRQVSHDTDFDHEDEELRDTWEKIDKYGSLKHRQELMGGAPVVPLHQTNIFPGLKESDCKYVQPGDESLVPQASFRLPNTPPEKPKQDTLDWLARELQNEEYYDESHINAKNFEKFILKPPEDTFANEDIEKLPVDGTIIESLRMSGINTMSDLIEMTAEELSHFPNLTLEIASVIKEYIQNGLKSDN